MNLLGVLVAWKFMNIPRNRTTQIQYTMWNVNFRSFYMTLKGVVDLIDFCITK